MSMNRVRCVWAGWPGAPGYTNFYTGTSIVNQTEIRTFFQALIGLLPTGLTIQVPNTGDVVDEVNGHITGAWSGAANTVVTGTQVGVYAGSVGACVNWRTGLLVAGRRPIGRSFLVPLIGAAFQADGSLAAATITTIQSAANTMITNLAGELKVWSRPRPTLTGQSVTVISENVPDLAVVLRSRRI
jgi:hypothetical protein